jgi:hypothetical protein
MVKDAPAKRALREGHFALEVRNALPLGSHSRNSTVTLVRHRHGFCRKWPVPVHGGRSTGALTDDGKARSLAAMRAGRQRWLEGMRAKKAAGEIERFPGAESRDRRWVTPHAGVERDRDDGADSC